MLKMKIGCHLDRQRSNNEVGNLVILCPTCHKMHDLDLMPNKVDQQEKAASDCEARCELASRRRPCGRGFGMAHAAFGVAGGSPFRQ